MVKVLWFETSVPCRYQSEKVPTMGWQDSLENLLRNRSDIDLYIAFEYKGNGKKRNIDGVNYIPLNISLNWYEKTIVDKKDRWLRVRKYLPLAIEIIKDIRPDIIHVFGTEWGFGQVARYVNVPVVIHMQGCIMPYQNAHLPPGYSILDKILSCGWNIKRMFDLWLRLQYEKSWVDLELSNFNDNKYYMGRTHWDKRLVELFHPGAYYYHVDEAIRPEFCSKNKLWSYKDTNTFEFVTTGCGSHWKGMDVVLKTANILKKAKIDFVWKLVGRMPDDYRAEIEKKENLYFSENNIQVQGFLDANGLKGLLKEASLYVHTAYIENSPNSICEAQSVGTPVIATNVGGVSTLIEDKVDGILVPSNDPFILASEILQLLKDSKRQMYYSDNSYKKASKRHCENNILRDLLSCYNSIIQR